MSDIQKISISLPKKMNAMVKKAVASGDYGSASEVVREALRDWKAVKKLKAENLAELRALIQEGIDSGPSEFKSIDEIKAEGRRRLALEMKKAS